MRYLQLNLLKKSFTHQWLINSKPYMQPYAKNLILNWLSLAVKMTVFIRWFSTRRSRPALLSCLSSKVHLPCSSVSVSILPLEQSCGARRYGLHLILLHPAQVLRYLLSVNILSSRKRQIKKSAYTARLYLRPKGRGFSRWSFLIKRVCRFAGTHEINRVLLLIIF